LYQELVPPAIQCFKALGVVYIVYEDTAVRSAIKSDSQGLKPFLAGGIPELKASA
jgi:hypothetical protein